LLSLLPMTPQSNLSLAGRFWSGWPTTLNRKEGRNKYLKQHIPNIPLKWNMH
jgi:hypothetical protein